MNKNNKPDITVSIASYNTCELLRACLTSVVARHEEGEANLQIIVVDNGSSDGSIQMVRDQFSTVELVCSSENLGYGRANNKAFEQARGRYFVALNSDAETPPGALRTLMRFLDEHPEVGAVGPQLVWPDGRLQASHGDDPQLLPILYEQTFIDKIARRLKPQTEETASEEPREVEQICGACQFMRSEAYRTVGGYDPAFFMYHEDVDLNIRLRRAGWKLYFVPEAKIVHHLGSSSRSWPQRARMVSALNWSRYYAFHRHEGARSGNALKAMFILGALLRLTIWTLATLRKPSRDNVDKVRLFRRVLRNAVAMKPF
jgi:N-acetylglucosaminyl-diphospho-decaprenol L-rhamnosyltransferase